MRLSLHVLALAVLGVGCSATPPPHWAEGGARLAMAEARWDRADGDPIELKQNGEVLEDGDVLFRVDTAGRVVDEDSDPVALLLPDGRLAGNDSVYLGQIGVSNAAPPWVGTAWLAVLPNGNVMRYAEDGERTTDGSWRGCRGAVLRTCTLVAHLVALHQRASEPRGSVGFGVGIGVYR